MGASGFQILSGQSKAAKAILAALLLAGLGVFVFLHLKSGRDRAEFESITRELAGLIRAEDSVPSRLEPALPSLKKAGAGGRGRAGRAALKGAEDYLASDYASAEAQFTALFSDRPNNAHLPSLIAASAYHRGENARAESYYLKALVLKSEKGLGGADLAADQIGLALSLMYQGRPEEALPLAASGWQARRALLGSGQADTLSAANRLAAIYVALGLNDEAEALLKSAFTGAAPAFEETSAGLAEAAHLLSVLYSQSGRLDELEDFFDQASAFLPPGLSVEEALELPRAALVGRKRVEEFKSLAGQLLRFRPALAAELMEIVLEARQGLDGLALASEELRPDLQLLAEALARSGRFDEAEKYLLILIDGGFDPRRDDFLPLSDLSAMSLAGQGRLVEAAIFLQSAADLVDRRIEEAARRKKKSDPGDAALSLHLHHRLADIFLAQGRVPQEAEIEMLSALARLDKNGLGREGGVERAEICLSLARLYSTLDKKNDQALYRQRAQETAQALVGGSSGYDRVRLDKILAAVRLEPGSDEKHETLENDELQSPWSFYAPSILRLEFEARRSLGRLDGFAEQLDGLLARVERDYGQDDRRYMAYYLIKLKTLEAEGRLDELTAELLKQAENPPGRGEAEKILNQGGALIYAAQASERAGRKVDAAGFYKKALAAFDGRKEEAIAERRRLAEEALKRLSDS